MTSDSRTDLGEDRENLLSATTESAPWPRKSRGAICALALVGLVMGAAHKSQAFQKAGLVSMATSDVIGESGASGQGHVLDTIDSVSFWMGGLADHKGDKDEKRKWVVERMQRVKSVKTVKALHHYYHIIGFHDLIGGPYKDQAEGQKARELVELGLHRYDGVDWSDYMNEEKATKKPPPGVQAGVGTTASLVSQVFPPDEKFVILILAWLPVGKYPWAGEGGVGAAHTHGQATCNFKFLNVVDGAGNTFYDVAGGTSTITDMFTDGLPHKGGCKDHDYRPILLKPDVGREFIPSKELIGNTSGYIQDDGGAHSIDNMNTTHIAFSIHVYYPPYAAAWAFHRNKRQRRQECVKRNGRGTPGHPNCVKTYFRRCTTTSMKKYLEEAAEYKRLHGDDNPTKWYHKFCEKYVHSEWLHKRCTKHYIDFVKHAEDIIEDDTLEQ